VHLILGLTGGVAVERPMAHFWEPPAGGTVMAEDGEEPWELGVHHPVVESGWRALTWWGVLAWWVVGGEGPGIAHGCFA